MKKNKQKKVEINAWGVINTELEVPCVTLNKEERIEASAIYSDEDGDAKEACRRYIKNYFGGKIPKGLGIKIVPCTISYSLPLKKSLSGKK